MKKFIHLSDIHYRIGWEENQDLVLDKFVDDLNKNIDLNGKDEFYLIITGDLVHAGSEKKLYIEFFQNLIEKLKIPKNNRIFIPGNHDVSQQFVSENSVVHQGIIDSQLNESDTNNFIDSKEWNIADKFDNYFDFVDEHSIISISKDSYDGDSFGIDSIGFYALNSSITSSGGYKNIDDKEKLIIGTRNLIKWLKETKSKYSSRVLLIHHPLSWLVEWAQTELQILIRDHFDLVLSGHEHEQGYDYKVWEIERALYCFAPPLFTNKTDQLGYAIINFEHDQLRSVNYRQWNPKGRNFVKGVIFSNNDDGSLNFNQDYFRVSEKLYSNLEDDLSSFSNQPKIWVTPIISKNNKYDFQDGVELKDKIEINEILNSDDDYILKSPPQFGLTCLGRKLALESWHSNKGFLMFLDIDTFKLHNLEREISRITADYNISTDQISGFIVDNWNPYDKKNFLLLQKIRGTYSSSKLIVLQIIDENKFFSEECLDDFKMDFTPLFVMALPRESVRAIVTAYNDDWNINEENAVVKKLVGELEALNMHRTPLNCITLLKVFDLHYDESPVNRTEMLHRVLFVLFNLDEIPTYKSKPDLKDVEHVLGFFMKDLIKKQNRFFTRQDFIKETRNYCSENLIELEVELVFDILFKNHIIVQKIGKYCFRFTYWIHYFAAHHMHHSKNFMNYIFQSQKYADHPELIEFYTGISRRSEDAVKILERDLKETSQAVLEKIGIPEMLDPYKDIKWRMSEKNIKKLKTDIKDEVQKSGLPEKVKDTHADESYNPERPYFQELNQIMREYSVIMLMQSIRASSRALRNSDYIKPEVKRSMMNEIMDAWHQITKVLFAISPILAEKGEATYDGFNVLLGADFGESHEEKVNNILYQIPNNVTRWFKSDLFSSKMMPVVTDYIKSSNNEVNKLELIIMVIKEKPDNWEQIISNYISTVSKNSFYLYKVFITLRSQINYGYNTKRQEHESEELMKKCLAKHQFGSTNPGQKLIAKIPDSDIRPKKIEHKYKSEEEE